MKLSLNTLTPLWTGGTDPKKMDRIQETGINGSLRWWYEAIVRGLAGAGRAEDKVCNATAVDSRERCNPEKANVCYACNLFGATGWARRFHLDLGGGTHLFNHAEQITVKAPDGKNGWVFGAPMISDESHQIAGHLRRVRGIHTINDLAVTFALINKWGGLGAKTQHGFGVVSLALHEDSNEIAIEPNVERFLRFGSGPTDDAGLPSLLNMFFARLTFSKEVPDDWWRRANLGSGIKEPESAPRWRLAPAWSPQSAFSVPIAPAIKYKLRFGGSPSGAYLPALRRKEPFFFGKTGDPNRKAMLNVSSAYKENGVWQFRIWGWLPEENAAAIDREQLMKELRGLITSDPAFWPVIFGAGVIDLSKSIWREIDVTGHRRNTAYRIAPTSGADFLRELLV